MLDTGIGQAFAEAGVRALAQLCDGQADLVVSHGQTMHHWVEAGTVRGTLQLGQPAWIAEATGLPVVADLRSRDVAAGGQGAPLVALFDALLLGGLPGVPAALNLGGIANITVVAPDADPLAFDTGPANALLDAAARHFSGGTEEYDRDGRGAAAGQVNPGLLRRLLDEPYYRLPSPKSTGKELFHLPYLLAALADAPTPDPQDVLATLTRLTAVTVAGACREHGVTRLVVSGGGAHNPTLLRHDRRRAARRRPVVQRRPGRRVGRQGGAGLRAAGLPDRARAARAPCARAPARGTPRVLGSITPGRQPLRLPTPVGTAPPRRSLVAASPVAD